MNKIPQSDVSISLQVMELVRDSPVLSHICSMPLLHPLFYVVQQFFHWLFMGYPLVPFCLFTWDKWLKVTERNYDVNVHRFSSAAEMSTDVAEQSLTPQQRSTQM